MPLHFKNFAINEIGILSGIRFIRKILKNISMDKKMLLKALGHMSSCSIAITLSNYDISWSPEHKCLDWKKNQIDFNTTHFNERFRYCKFFFLQNLKVKSTLSIKNDLFRVVFLFADSPPTGTMHTSEFVECEKNVNKRKWKRKQHNACW